MSDDPSPPPTPADLLAPGAQSSTALADETAGELSGWSRRVFLHRLTFMGGGVVLLGACSKSGPESQQPPAPRARGIQAHGLTSSHRTFTDEEFATLSAAVDRIVPRDQDPGALDAQVPTYIDRMLATPELAKMREDFVAGLNALDRRSQRSLSQSFAQATPEQRDGLLSGFKDSRPGSGEEHFYGLLITLTLEGFLGDPSYGGNKDRVGWALVGFGTSEPPPGYDGAQQLHHHGGGIAGAGGPHGGHH